MSNLSKEEMFDFILENRVEIRLSEGKWIREDGTEYYVSHYVSINETIMIGMDIEEAIQYYHDHYERK